MFGNGHQIEVWLAEATGLIVKYKSNNFKIHSNNANILNCIVKNHHEDFNDRVLASELKTVH